jgi:glutamate N-acetyltransferase/amino-acid N-acetyltransferase
VTAAGGFLAAGVHCGVKHAVGVPDLGVVVSSQPAAAAGVFTRNRAPAAPVLVSKRHLQGGSARAIVVNSGNANACTGAQGLADAEEMAQLTADRFGLQPHEVLVLSTGVIGVALPMAAIRAGVEQLAVTREGGAAFAQAIMTTDTRPKTAVATCMLDGATCRIGGAAKGSGMIHPNMATMLAIITTDAAANPGYLQQALGRAVDASFNLISVDGDTSTNDAVLLLASGAAGGASLDGHHPDAAAFERALQEVCQSLAIAVVRDGEGAHTLIEVAVTGATSDADARAVARSITTSNLVKTAVFGGDPNWGRVICAAGNAGVPIDADRATLYLADICLFRRGAGLAYDRAVASALLKQPDVRFSLDLALGEGSAVAWGCDMSYEYVRINAEYTT